MSTPEPDEPAKPARKAKRGPQPPSNVSLSPGVPPPTARLDEMTKGRIAALGEDKRQLQAEVSRLQGLVDRLGPENSRLAESLANAESNNVLATILVGVGGFAVSYATFAGAAASGPMANASAGCLLAGIGMMCWQALRRRGRT